MRSTDILMVAFLGLALSAPATSYADPKPIPVNPTPKDKVLSFPMKSEDFRPFFDKLMAYFEQAAARAAAKGKQPPPGWADRTRFAASQAMEDGWVTADEFQKILNAGDR